MGVRDWGGWLRKGTGEEWERYSGEKEERGGREGMGGGADSPTERGMIVRRMTECKMT